MQKGTDLWKQFLTRVRGEHSNRRVNIEWFPNYLLIFYSLKTPIKVHVLCVYAVLIITCSCTPALCSRQYCCTMASIGPVSTEVCCDIFRELRSQSVQENVCYSPLLIISTLSMVYIGAKDNTKAQIEKVRIHLGFKPSCCLT